jgi:tetratricopeptide (TPR) repeat protein
MEDKLKNKRIFEKIQHEKVIEMGKNKWKQSQTMLNRLRTYVRIRSIVILSLGMLMLVTLGSIEGTNPIDKKAYSQWWLKEYGDYANSYKGKKDSRVKEAENIFKKLSNIAEIGGGGRSRLFIIDTEGQPFALAIRDGNIIISKKALDICYTGVDKKKGNQRMAFILGHELAHQANKDFMHQEAFYALKQYANEKAMEKIKKMFNLDEIEKSKECRQKELMADRMGAFYAFMAGFDISDLLNKKDAFFSIWAGQSGVKNFYDAHGDYPSLQSRIDFIQAQLKDVVYQLKLFKAGVLLYQRGSLFDAAAVFSEFLKTYLAREVFNNIGACHLNIALRRLMILAPTELCRFRISTTIDSTTTAEAMEVNLKGTQRGLGYLNDEIFLRHISEAERFFKIAVEKDPDNKASRLNLSAALILRADYAAVQSLLKNDEKDVKLLNNKAIAFHYYGQMVGLDTTQDAIQYLQEAHEIDSHDFEVVYNLASIKAERKRMAGAKKFWEKYLELSPPRDMFYRNVCDKLGRKCPTRSSKKENPPGIGINIDIGKTKPDVEKILKKAVSYSFKVGSGGTQIKKKNNEDEYYTLIDLEVKVAGNYRILLLDEMVELIERQLEPDKSLQEMLSTYGPPDNIVRHTTGNFYVYESKGFSFKEVGGKVQAFTWFEPNG